MPKFGSVIVIIADQVASREHADAVPDALEALSTIVDDGPSSRRFARTAGDEIQGLIDDPAAAVAVIEALSRDTRWRIGVGIGAVQRPLPDTVQAATGPAFFAAREAVGHARGTSQQLAVQVDDGAAAAQSAAHDAFAALTMLRALWAKRSSGGWEVNQLRADGFSPAQIAQRLGVTASAISQRTRAGALEETDAGMRLAAHCLAACVAETAASPSS